MEGMSQYGTYGLTLMGKTGRKYLLIIIPGAKLVNLYDWT